MEADEKAKTVEDLLKTYRHGQINALVEEKCTRMLLRLNETLFRRVVDYILEEHEGYHLLPRNVKEAIAECKADGVVNLAHEVNCPFCGTTYTFLCGATVEEGLNKNAHSFCPDCGLSGEDADRVSFWEKTHKMKPPWWEETVDKLLADRARRRGKPFFDREAVLAEKAQWEAQEELERRAASEREAERGEALREKIARQFGAQPAEGR
jgi:hypothetical protein